MFVESRSGSYSKMRYNIHRLSFDNLQQEGQHPLTGQRAANIRLLANQ